MIDPSAHDPWLRALAYLHPLWMSSALAVAGLAARSGLRMRRARRLASRRDPADRARHLRLAKGAVVAIALGAAGGPLSMAFLRGREPFATTHAWIASLALALFVTTAVLGRRLERGRSRAVEAHAASALGALLAGALAALTGFVLLP